MADTFVVSGLVAKRAEMAGLIDHHKKQIARLANDLAHVDATLKLFAPEMDLRTLRPKEHRIRNAYFRPCEAPRFILDTLRQAGTPLTSRDIAEATVTAKGLEGTAAMLVAIQKSLLATLKMLTKAGTLTEGTHDGSGRTWKIA